MALWAFDWENWVLTAERYGGGDRVAAHNLVGNSIPEAQNEANAWIQSLEAYQFLLGIGWPQSFLCKISYYTNLSVCQDAGLGCTSDVITGCLRQDESGQWSEYATVVTKRCVNGQYVDTGLTCPTYSSDDNEVKDEERDKLLLYLGLSLGAVLVGGVLVVSIKN